MNLQRFFLIFTFILGCMNFTAAQAEITNPAFIQINNLDQKITVAESLFIINSNIAVLSPQKKQNLLLTLRNVQPYVTKYTVGPDKKTRLALTEDIVQDWLQGKNNFARVNPNAALAGIPLSKTKNQSDYLFQLSNPVYDAKRNTLTFNVKWLGTAPEPREAVTFTNVSLFVDDGIDIALNSKTNLITTLMENLFGSRHVS